MYFKSNTMKTKNNLIVIALAVLTLSSCKTTFYQVYRAIPADRSIVTINAAQKDFFPTYVV